jgi:excisionase family DNA binding protein
MAQQESIGISEASRFLGVSEAALRQWTDEGKIKAFVTPGGHRRYLRNELKKFISTRSKILGVKDLVSELEETVEIHREIAGKLLSSESWYKKLPRESIEYFADLGRTLLNLIVKYISEPSRRGEIILLIREVGQNMGETLATHGLPLAESVEAFLMHREPIINASTNLLKKREAITGRVVDAIPLAIQVFDEALVALVAAHQLYRNGLNKSEKETKN